jgi:hypothetical protein
VSQGVRAIRRSRRPAHFPHGVRPRSGTQLRLPSAPDPIYRHLASRMLSFADVPILPSPTVNSPFPRLPELTELQTAGSMILTKQFVRDLEPRIEND